MEQYLVYMSLLGIILIPYLVMIIIRKREVDRFSGKL